MAGPPSAERRRHDNRRVAGGFVAFVAVSAGLVAARSGASLPEAAGIVLAGLLVGAGLLAVLVGRR